MSQPFVSLADLGVEDVSQLPDWVFGDRDVIHLEILLGGSGSGALISNVAFPGRIMLWRLFFRHTYTSGAGDYVRIGLASGVPASEAEMLECRPLLTQFGEAGAGLDRVVFGAFMQPWGYDLREVVSTDRLKLVVWYYSAGGANAGLGVGVVYSRVPDRIPVWIARHLGLMGG
jgi:hypothetical protein